MKHKALILELLHVLVDKTKSERGYSSAGRLLTRLLHTLSGVYPLNSRFVNTDEWDSEGKLEFFFGIGFACYVNISLYSDFEKNHNLYWGRMYGARDVVIEWHGLYTYPRTMVGLYL